MQTSLALSRPAACRRVAVQKRGIRAQATQTAEVEAAPKAAPAAGSRQSEIYIGHSKDQIEEKKAGKKGRFVVDDPTKYPGRDNEYVGGWAGGEAGLKAFVANYQREKELNAAPAAPAKEAKDAREPQPIAKGNDTIYVGKGRVIKDDARKYPGRNELTGGFAGGELGLAAFKEKGDVPIAPEGQGTRQSSPLITAFVLGLAATGGGLLLSTVEQVGVGAVEGGAAAASATSGLGLDEQTKALVTAGILLVGVIGTVVGTQVLVDTMASRIRAGASKLATLGAFWVVVFLAAKYVLES